jgi:amino acid permease
VSWIFAIVIPDIGAAMQILGATTNTAIGFLFPIIYYLKLEEKAPRFASHKVVAYIVFVFMVFCSIIELTTFVMKYM